MPRTRGERGWGDAHYFSVVQRLIPCDAWRTSSLDSSARMSLTSTRKLFDVPRLGFVSSYRGWGRWRVASATHA